MKGKKHLTEAQRFRLRQLWLYGVKSEAIAGEFNITRATVQYHTRDIKRSRTKPKRIDDDKAWTLRQMGYPQSLIAKCFRVTPSCVEKAIKRAERTL